MSAITWTVLIVTVILIIITLVIAFLLWSNSSSGVGPTPPPTPVPPGTAVTYNSTFGLALFWTGNSLFSGLTEVNESSTMGPCGDRISYSNSSGDTIRFVSTTGASSTAGVRYGDQVRLQFVKSGNYFTICSTEPGSTANTNTLAAIPSGSAAAIWVIDGASIGTPVTAGNTFRLRLVGDSKFVFPGSLGANPTIPTLNYGLSLAALGPIGGGFVGFTIINIQ